MSFGGTSDRIQVTGSLGDTSAGLTVELWINTSASSSGQPVVAVGSASAPAVTLSVGSAGDAVSVALVDTTGVSHALASPGGSLSKGAWHHVALTFDGAHALLYIDGSQTASTVAAVTLAPPSGLAIGSSAAGDAYFAGGLDEVAVYGKALPADRIADRVAIAKNGPHAATWPLYRWLADR
jgi:hypothetical protein